DFLDDASADVVFHGRAAGVEMAAEVADDFRGGGEDCAEVAEGGVAISAFAGAVDGDLSELVVAEKDDAANGGICVGIAKSGFDPISLFAADGGKKRAALH